MHRQTPRSKRTDQLIPYTSVVRCPCHEIHRVAQQMDDACLDHRFGVDGGDGDGEALQAIDDGHHDILDAAVAQFVHDAQPAFGALIDRKSTRLYSSNECASRITSLARKNHKTLNLIQKTNAS